MNTLQDLNNYGNTPVNYTSQADYNIVFGNNAGNITTEVFQGQILSVPKQTTITTLDSAVRDVLVSIEANGAPLIKSFKYYGSYSNISTYQLSDTSWYIGGIRDVNRYNEAMAQCQIEIDPLANIGINYSYVVSVNDQTGNIRSWTVTANVQQAYDITGNITFSEDVPVPINNVQVEDRTSTNFTLTFEVADPALGQLGYGNVIGNSVTITNNRLDLNNIIAGNSILFYPAGDSITDTAVKYTQLRALGNIYQAQQLPIPVRWNGNSHDDWQLTTPLTYLEDTPANISGVQITDIYGNYRPTTYTVTFKVKDPAMGNIVYNGNVIGSSVSLTDTQANLNTFFTNNRWKYYPALDRTSTSVVQYTQVRDADNKVQANDVEITFNNAGTHNEYQVPSQFIYNEDFAANLTGIVITDLADQIEPTTYTITISTPSVSAGRINYLGNLATSHTITANRSAINTTFANGGLQFQPAPDYVQNTSVRYTQIRNVDNKVQAGNIVIPMRIGNTHNDYSISSKVILETATDTDFLITDTDPVYDSYVVTIAAQDVPTGFLLQSSSQSSSNSITLTGTRSVLNTDYISFTYPDDQALRSNVTLRYTQTKITGSPYGNIVQADQVISYPAAVFPLRTSYPVTGNVSTPLFSGSNVLNVRVANARVTLSVTNGNLYLSNNISLTKSLTITSPTSSDLEKVYYIPNVGQTSNDSLRFRFTDSANTVVYIDRTITMPLTPYTPPTFYSVYSANTTYTPTLDQDRFMQIDVVLVGGGGGGSDIISPSNTTWLGAAGGGGGEATIYTDFNFEYNKTYNFVIGRGGNGDAAQANTSTNGGSTYITLSGNTIASAAGGLRALTGINGANAVAGGFIGGTGANLWPNSVWSGGGAGAGGNGNNGQAFTSNKGGDGKTFIQFPGYQFAPGGGGLGFTYNPANANPYVFYYGQYGNSSPQLWGAGGLGGLSGNPGVIVLKYTPRSS